MQEAGAAAFGGGGARPALALALLLAAYLGLAIGYQRAVPLFEAPDEPSHVLYVAFVATTGELPHRFERRDVPGEGMQPPLYYLLQAPLFAAISGYDPGLLSALHDVCLRIYGLVDMRSAPSDGPVRVDVRGSRRIATDPALEYLRALRWGSLLLGVLAVSASFAAARRAFASTPAAWLSAALLAFTPQFLFVSSYVNNDVACAALGALAFWLFARALERGRVARGDYAAAGALVALGMATKHSALPALALTAVALLALDARPPRARLRDAALAALLGLLLASPVLVTNVARFGDPFGVSAVLASAHSLPDHGAVGGRLRYLLDEYPLQTFTSYWGTFGWMNVFLPAWLYLAFLGLSAVGTFGLLRGAWAERRGGRAPAATEDAARRLWRRRALRRYLLASALVTLAAHVWLNLHALAAQGRHLFGAAPQIAALLALGIGSLRDPRASGPGWKTAAGVAAGMAGAALCGLVLLRAVYAG
jgi:4-amino-4-deoxy-L-arabinose transferase-like glycosyltransferase